MKDTKLGEFEELLLLIIIFLQKDAYNLRIRDELKAQAQRFPTLGALYTALTRLEKKGFLESNMADAEDIREGRRKRIYAVTAAGKAALHEAHTVRNRLWTRIEHLKPGWAHA